MNEDNWRIKAAQRDRFPPPLRMRNQPSIRIGINRQRVYSHIGRLADPAVLAHALGQHGVRLAFLTYK